MARGRSYKLGVFDTATWTATGAGNNNGTTSYPILYWVGATTAQPSIFNISVGVMGVGTIPSNASVAWSLNAATGTVAGGTAAVPAAINIGPATGGTALSSTAVTAPKTGGGSGAALITGVTTTGISYWDRVTPFAAGANWEDIVTYGDEITLPPVATGFGIFVTASASSTSCAFFAEIEWSE